MYALRTRIKKLADWATPLSFFVRHYAWERYHGVLATPAVRRPLIVAALAMPILVLAGAIPGFWGCLRGSDAHVVLGWTLLYWVPAMALINGMSRYRVGLEPLLIVLAAGFLSGAATRVAALHDGHLRGRRARAGRAVGRKRAGNRRPREEHMVAEFPGSSGSARPGRWRAYTLHVLLLAVVGGECLAAPASTTARRNSLLCAKLARRPNKRTPCLCQPTAASRSQWSSAPCVRSCNRPSRWCANGR